MSANETIQYCDFHKLEACNQEPEMCQGGTSHHQQITNRLLHSSDLFTCIERNGFREIGWSVSINYAHTIILILLLILILVLLLILILVLLLRLTTCTCTCTYTYAYALVYLPYIWVSILSLTRPWLWVCPTPHKVGAPGGGGIVLIYLFTSSSLYYYYYYYYIGTSTN